MPHFKLLLEPEHLHENYAGKINVYLDVDYDDTNGHVIPLRLSAIRTNALRIINWAKIPDDFIQSACENNYNNLYKNQVS